jgi:hypothetical protein
VTVPSETAPGEKSLLASISDAEGRSASLLISLAVVPSGANSQPAVEAGGPYSVYEGEAVSLSAAGSDPDGDVLSYAWDLDNDGTFETSGASVAFSAAALDGPGSQTIQVRASDPGGLAATAQGTVNILNANPAVSAGPASQSVQYSDPLSVVLIRALDAPGDLPLSLASMWRLDGSSFIDGLPDWLALTPGGCGGNACDWRLSGTPLALPGTYEVQVTASDKDGGSSSTSLSITVAPEDARATYTGALFAATSALSSGTAVVTLAATVQDISAADPDSDPHSGDIRFASVHFVDRDKGDALLCSAAVGLIDPLDTGMGTATCSWTVDLGNAESLSANVGTVIGGPYLRDSFSEDVVVTVSRPLAGSLINGGGYLLLEESAGLLAGDEGAKANFGFNARYINHGRGLNGQFSLILRRTEGDGLHLYQIKGSAFSSLAVQPDAGRATFNARAVILDITDPLAPVSIDGNASLQVKILDNGEPGSSDAIGITLWSKNGGLWFSSHWDGVQTIEQILDGGNLYVK